MAAVKKYKKQKAWAMFSLVRAVGWAGCIPLAYFAGWIYSVAFVAVCSLYANVASDFAAWRADDNPQFEYIEDLLEEICTKLGIDTEEIDG